MPDSSHFEFRDINCPACGGDLHKFVGWRGGRAHHSGSGELTAIVRCIHCTHQYPNPMPFPKGNLDELYFDADKYFFGHDIEKKKENGLRMMRQFEERLGKKGRILDVGCGVGENLWAALQSGWQAEGVDPSSEFIRLGKERLGVSGRNCTLEEAGFCAESFDVIMMSSIIEHLYDPFMVLVEATKLLKNGGWLWLDAPNEDGLYMRLGNVYMALQRKDWVVVMAPTFPPYHVQGFNPSSIKTLVERSGLYVREINMIGAVCEQTGEKTLRKRAEYLAASAVNRLGRAFNSGTYMTIWAQKTV
ncbi:MAG: class I SAM-dependent methyltransferase [Acidobacteria bacterium]|nr:class I SAM-dependent methyltransferase [Acidobacteriota bacterium]